MSRPTRYREIEVHGTPFELGRQIGEAARDEIRGFADIVMERTNKSVTISRERALQLSAESFPYVENYSADMLEEIRGMAESSGISADELMLLNIRNQFRDEPAGGCTAFSIAPNAHAHRRSIVGQNWDNDPALDPFTVVLTRRPDGKPAIMDVTQAGLIAYIGLNDRGIGLCMNTLPAPSRPLGVPHYFTVRGIYEADSLDGAATAVRRAERAIPSNIMMATPQGPADLENTMDDVRVLRDEGSGFVTHTNHCLHPDLAAINDDFSELIESGPRKQRVDGLLSALSSPPDVERLKEILRDHDGFPRSICRHENDHPATGFWTTVFSVIIEADAGRMHISRGNPCECGYEVYTLN
jgi:isopenicillin-N N-acyltransferase-like protein